LTVIPTPTPDLEALLIDTSIECWRFSRLFLRATGKLDAGEGARYENQLRFFLRRLEDNLSSAGMTLVNVEGQVFDAGMAATALNIEDFGPQEELVVDQMVEPIIMGTEGIRRTGTVTLRQASR
jgi:hypothetical protein